MVVFSSSWHKSAVTHAAKSSTKLLCYHEYQTFVFTICNNTKVFIIDSIKFFNLLSITSITVDNVREFSYHHAGYFSRYREVFTLDSSINVPVSIATQFHLGKESKEGIIHVGTPSKSSYPFFVFLEILTRID